MHRHGGHGVSHHHHHHHHHHHGGRHKQGRVVKVVHINPYEHNPSIVTLVWNRTIHGYDENDPALNKMTSQGYDPYPLKAIIGEFNAMSKEINFDDNVPEPNVFLCILFFLLGIFPLVIYLMWVDCKKIEYLGGENRFREAAQALVNKHNPVLTERSRCYLVANWTFPYVLCIHLVRDNANNPQAMRYPQNPQHPQPVANQNGANRQMMLIQ